MDIGELASRYSFWETIAFVGAAIVLLGVLGEEIPEHTSWLRNERLRRLSRRFGAALLLIGLAIDVITILVASGITEVLIAQVQPRRLTTEQKTSVAQKVNKFSGELVGVSWYRSSPDSKDFAGDIKAALDLAGWQVGLGSIVTEPRVVSGILIEINNPSVREPAETLANALRNEHFEVTGPMSRIDVTSARGGFMGDAFDPAMPMFITVGNKP